MGHLPFSSLYSSKVMAGYNIPFYFGGTRLLIIVGVYANRRKWGYLLSRQYDGMDRRSQGGGRRSKVAIDRE